MQLKEPLDSIEPEAQWFVAKAHLRVSGPCLHVRYDSLEALTSQRRPGPDDIPGYDPEVLDLAARRSSDFEGTSGVLLGSGVGLITPTTLEFLYFRCPGQKQRWENRFGPHYAIGKAVLGVFRDIEFRADTLSGGRQYRDSIKAALAELPELLFADPNDGRWVLPELRGDFGPYQEFYHALTIQAWRRQTGRGIAEPWEDLRDQINPQYHVTIRPCMRLELRRALDSVQNQSGRTTERLIAINANKGTLDEIIPAVINSNREVVVCDSEFDDEGDGRALNRFPVALVEMPPPAPSPTMLFALDSVHGGIYPKLGGFPVEWGSPHINAKTERLLEAAGFDLNRHDSGR